MLVLFLIDKGSTVMTGFGIPLGGRACFGVTSVFPVGSNGCRLLRVNEGVVMGSAKVRVGVVGACVTFTRVFSSASSTSIEGNKPGEGLGGGLKLN